MSAIQIQRVESNGQVLLSHSRVREDGSTDEHFYRAFLRHTDAAAVLYCHLCNAVTQVPQGDSENRRLVDEAMAAKALSIPVAAVPDPLAAAREDGYDLPAKLPSDSIERKKLIDELRAEYRDPR